MTPFQAQPSDNASCGVWYVTVMLVMTCGWRQFVQHGTVPVPAWGPWPDEPPAAGLYHIGLEVSVTEHMQW